VWLRRLDLGDDPGLERLDGEWQGLAVSSFKPDHVVERRGEMRLRLRHQPQVPEYP
jgi:hypothetical protein